MRGAVEEAVVGSVIPGPVGLDDFDDAVTLSATAAPMPTTRSKPASATIAGAEEDGATRITCMPGAFWGTCVLPRPRSSTERAPQYWQVSTSTPRWIGSGAPHLGHLTS